MASHNYLLLSYAPSVLAEATTPCLVVVKEISPLHPLRPSPQLKVYSAPAWPEAISEEHREYITAVMEDVGQTKPGEADAVFTQLSEMSLGPLRAVKSGSCDSAELETLLHNFLAS